MSSMNELKAKFDAQKAALRISYDKIKGENPDSWNTKAVTKELQEEFQKWASSVPRSFRKRGKDKKKTTTEK
jgi:hypothetical protein